MEPTPVSCTDWTILANMPHHTFLDLMFTLHTWIYPVNYLDLTPLTETLPLFTLRQTRGNMMGTGGKGGSSPCHDDEEVQAVPRVPEVTAATEDPQGDHLYNHLHREEDVDECIKGLREGDRGTDEVSNRKTTSSRG